MPYRNGNYSAFYVEEPFVESNLKAHATRDFNYYNLLRAWKGKETAFSFIDSHDKNYDVRDGSDWEKTLRPRIRERLNNSKNVIFFLSSITRDSRALHEEINYGINTCKLPVIVIYPEYSEESDIINCATKHFKQQIVNLWDKIPVFRRSMTTVPTLHVPLQQALVKSALKDEKFMLASKTAGGRFFFPC